MSILVKSHTKPSDKNKFATTLECFRDAEYLFKSKTGKTFVLDVCAEPQTAKVERYYLSPDWISEQDGDFSALGSPLVTTNTPGKCVGFNALQQNWCDGWYCNPPFDQKFRFIRKAIAEADQGRDGLMLLPYEPLSGWWRDYVDGFATLVFEPDGRYNFYESDGVTKKKGVNFGSALVLFTKRLLTTPRERFNRGIHRQVR